LPEERDSAILPRKFKTGKGIRVLARSEPGLLKKIVTTVGGISLIFIGLVGLFLPVLQGILFIVAGLGLLSISNERVRDWMVGVKKRYKGGEFSLKRIKTKILSRKRPSHD